ncbi:MAG: response regulator [Aeromonadaceae bacterium]
MMQIDKQRPILIIEDCAVMSNALRGMLQKMGFRADQIDLADSAKMAIPLCTAKPYQLVLLDFNLATHGMNGYQLLATLRNEQWLAVDCVIVVVTAEASIEVIRSFMELEPDGYLIKPISYKGLSQRIQALLSHKQQLCPLLQQRRERNLPQVLVRGQFLARGRGITSLQARLVMAEACVDAAEFERAHRLLIGLKSTRLRNRARLLMARAALLQQHLDAVYALIQPLQDDPLLCSAALTFKAEASILQQRSDLALASIRQAIALSPRGSRRYWLQAFIEMADFDLPAAQETVQRGLRYVRYMQQDEIPLQQLLAALNLDAAESAKATDRAAALSRFRSVIKGWQGQRLSPMAQSTEALLQLRAELLSGLTPSIDAIIEHHRQCCSTTPAYQLNLVEEMEWHKLSTLVQPPARLQEYVSTLKSRLPWNRRQTFRMTMGAYMQHWQSSMANEGANAA